MLPGSRYTIVNHEKISFDSLTFSKLYLPVIGKTAFTLYHLLQTKISGRVSDLLEYLNVGMNDFERALDKLSALQLLLVYDEMPDYRLVLRSPKVYEDFMGDEFYRQLLIGKLGPQKVTEMIGKSVSGKNISKKFSQVFRVPEEMDLSKSNKPGNLGPSALNIETFKKMMEKRGLSFANENADLIHLFSMAEKFDLDWYALFKLAESSVQSDHTINTFAMIRQLINQSGEEVQVPDPYKELISIAKSVGPKAFLTQLKRQSGGRITTEEANILRYLQNEVGLADELQNMMIHYLLIQQDKATLKKYDVEDLVNDWDKHKVHQAEEAIARILAGQIGSTSKKVQSKSRTKKVKKLPAWSNPDYKNQSSSEELKEFQAVKDSLLKAAGGKHGADR